MAFFADDPEFENCYPEIDEDKETVGLMLKEYLVSRFSCEVLFDKTCFKDDYRIDEYLYVHDHDFRLVFYKGELISLEVNLDGVLDLSFDFIDYFITERINSYCYELDDYYEIIRDYANDEEEKIIIEKRLIETRLINMKSAGNK